MSFSLKETAHFYIKSWFKILKTCGTVLGVERQVLSIIMLKAYLICIAVFLLVIHLGDLGFFLFCFCLGFFSPHKIEMKLFFSPEAWTSMMYWCKSCPCWMTSKVMLFMASFRSVWRCNRCSARVRSSVLKSFICLSRSSFQASNSAVTFMGRRQTPRINEISYSQTMFGSENISDSDPETFKLQIRLLNGDTSCFS